MSTSSALLVLTSLMMSVGLHAEPRTCRIIYPGRPQGSLKTAYLFDGTASRSVTLPSMNLSEVIELPDGEISIALTTEEISNPDHLPANAPRMDIAESVDDFYIILTPDPKNGYLSVQMILADVGDGKIHSGETLWYNFTAHRIAAKLGDAEMSLDPHSQRVSKPPVGQSGYYAARFQYQAGGEGPLAAMTEQNWWHDAQNRSLGFIMDSGDRLPKIMMFRDFRIAGPAQGPESADRGEPCVKD